MEKERIQYFDLLKGVAIFMVIMGHIITICIRGIDTAFLFKLIANVHMPVFFFINGFLSYKEGFAMPNMLKRARQLLLPTVVVSAIWVLYFPHSHLQSPIKSTFAALYADTWKNGYWFTFCLFELFAIYCLLSVIYRKVTNTALQIAIAIAFYATIVLLKPIVTASGADYAGMEVISRFFPIFIIGFFAHRHIDIYKRAINGSWPLIAAIAMFVPSFYLIAYPLEVPALTDWKSITIVIMHTSALIIALTLAASWSSNEYAPGNKPSAFARFFSMLGKESLGIYLLHYFFLFPLNPLQDPLRNLGLQFAPLLAVSVIGALTVLVPTLLTIYLLRQNKWLSRIFTGK